jgi:hypothetical protein
LIRIFCLSCSSISLITRLYTAAETTNVRYGFVSGPLKCYYLNFIIVFTHCGKPKYFINYPSL